MAEAQRPVSIFDGSDETLLNTKQQRDFLGGVSDMFLARREKDDPDFPKARWIAGRKYRTLGELRRYRDSRPRFRVVGAPKHRPPPPRKQPPPRKAKQAVKVAATTSSPES